MYCKSGLISISSNLKARKGASAVGPLQYSLSCSLLYKHLLYKDQGNTPSKLSHQQRSTVLIFEHMTILQIQAIEAKPLI
jgi:hypothetical protein